MRHRRGMGDVVNLRLMRKARDRAAAERAAAVSRAVHGLTPAQKRADADEADRRRRLLDGARRDGD